MLSHLAVLSDHTLTNDLLYRYALIRNKITVQGWMVLLQTRKTTALVSTGQTDAFQIKTNMTTLDRSS